MFPALPDAPGGGSASVSRPPRSVLSPNTGSLCKFSPVAGIGSQLGDVCARHVGDVETAQMYVRTRVAPRVAAHRSGWAGVATSASATAFTPSPRRQTMNWAVMRRRRAIPCALGTACRRWGRPDRGGLRKGRCCDSGHRAGGHGEWRHESWGVRPQERGHGARRERRRPRWCCCAIARALCARGSWKGSARCALRRRKYCRCNGGDSGRRHAWRRLERRSIRSQRRARVRLNTLLNEEV